MRTTYSCSPIRNEFDVLDLQGDIDAIANWVNTAGLTLNQSKTKLLLLSRKRQPPSIILSTNSGQITQVDSLSYLGVTITKDLKWNSHISNTCAKAKSKLTNHWCSYSLITVAVCGTPLLLVPSISWSRFRSLERDSVYQLNAGQINTYLC